MNNNIDAIFIQSQRKELESNRLYNFLQKNYRILNSAGVPIYIFFDHGSQDLINKISDFRSLFKKMVFIIDNKYENPTTYCFRFLMNYRHEEHPRVILLETDCALKTGFIETLNKDLNKIKNKWYIYGSSYYGKSTFSHIENPEKKNFYKNHMNGVAVYNRSNDFVSTVNKCFNDIKADYLKLNYDMALYKVMASYNLLNLNIDSDFILNISSQGDQKLNYKLLKPYAAIVHSKNSDSINLY
jgi:hypothetical protein